MGGNVIIVFNTFHHSNHLRLLIWYTGHLDDNKTDKTDSFRWNLCDVISFNYYATRYYLDNIVCRLLASKRGGAIFIVGVNALSEARKIDP